MAELVHAHEEEVQIKLAAVPVSVQAKKDRRDAISAELKAVTADIPILFSGDVGVTVELWRSEQEHYESDRSADIDNVIKPILDGLAGPDGVMIDDNQVQHVQCYWNQHVQAPAAMLTIDNRMREYVYKKDLAFIHMGKQLYFPMNNFGSPELATGMLDMLQKYRETRDELETKGMNYSEYRYLMPVQRYFHRTRLGRFRCIELEDARREYI
jgi:Holliday junction resolvase RusA-like endonuclease